MLTAAALAAVQQAHCGAESIMINPGKFPARSHLSVPAKASALAAATTFNANALHAAGPRVDFSFSHVEQYLVEDDVQLNSYHDVTLASRGGTYYVPESKAKATFTIQVTIDRCATESRKPECLNSLAYAFTKATEFAKTVGETGLPHVGEEDLLSTKTSAAAGVTSIPRRSWDSGATYGMPRQGDDPSREYVGSSVRIAT